MRVLWFLCCFVTNSLLGKNQVRILLGLRPRSACSIEIKQRSWLLQLWRPMSRGGSFVSGLGSAAVFKRQPQCSLSLNANDHFNSPPHSVSAQAASIFRLWRHLEPSSSASKRGRGGSRGRGGHFRLFGHKQQLSSLGGWRTRRSRIGLHRRFKQKRITCKQKN